jgi:uncharacterized protein
MITFKRQLFLALALCGSLFIPTTSYGAMSYLMQAAGEGDLQAIAACIQSGIDLNSRDWLGETALTTATKAGRLNVVDRLLQAGANPNIQEAQGQTALMLAATSGNTNIATSLIHAQANLNIQDPNGGTALHKAAFFGHNEIVELLAGAMTEPLTQEIAVLHDAWTTSPVEICGLVGTFINPLDIPNNNGQTALMEIVQNSNPDIATIEMLVLGGASTDIQDNAGHDVFYFVQNNTRLLAEQKDAILAKLPQQ